MHTYKICITFLSLLSIAGASSFTIAQNSRINSTLNGTEINPLELATDSSCQEDTIKGGERCAFQSVNRGASAQETHHRGSGRFENNEFV